MEESFKPARYIDWGNSTCVFSLRHSFRRSIPAMVKLLFYLMLTTWRFSTPMPQKVSTYNNFSVVLVTLPLTSTTGEKFGRLQKRSKRWNYLSSEYKKSSKSYVASDSDSDFEIPYISSSSKQFKRGATISDESGILRKLSAVESKLEELCNKHTDVPSSHGSETDKIYPFKT